MAIMSAHEVGRMSTPDVGSVSADVAVCNVSAAKVSAAKVSAAKVSATHVSAQSRLQSRSPHSPYRRERFWYERIARRKSILRKAGQFTSEK